MPTEEEILAAEFAELTGTSEPVVAEPAAQVPEVPTTGEVPVVTEPAAVPPAEVPVAPVVEPAQVAAPANDEVLKQLREDNEALRAQLLQFAASQHPQAFPAAPTETPAVAAQTPAAAAPTAPTVPAFKEFNLEPIKLLTEDEIEELIDKPELIVKAINDARANTIQQVQQVLPNLVSEMVNKQILISKAVTDYYDSNRDLIPVSEFFRMELAKAEAAGGGKTYREIFDEAAKATRTTLRMNQPAPQGVTPPAQPAQPGQPQQPAFATTRQSPSGRPAQGPSDELSKEFYDLLP